MTVDALNVLGMHKKRAMGKMANKDALTAGKKNKDRVMCITFLQAVGVTYHLKLSMIQTGFYGLV